MSDVDKVNDSEASPFIEQKDVILCRSGIQYYHKSEVASFITEDSKPPVEKEWYREYRPASVVVRAKEKCRSLPVAKEHPDVWVTPKNFSILAGGTTGKDVEVVALDGESEGEIGLKTDITFYTDTLYEYYKLNREVSLGYTCRKHWVPNPEEVGYDIILDEIEEVNHLAITRSGRGGSSVAVIDSLIGGMKPMASGLFAWIKSVFQKDSKPEISFGNTVLDSIKAGMDSDEVLAKGLTAALDTCALLKDCEAKNILMEAVRDAFSHGRESVENADGVIAGLDAKYEEAVSDSVKSFVSDSDEKKEEEQKDAEPDSSDEPAAEKEEQKDDTEQKDSDEKKEEDGCSKDSDPDEQEQKDSDEPEKTAGSDEQKDDTEQKDSDEKKDDCITKDSIEQIVKDSISAELRGIVIEAVKDCLGIKEDRKPSVEGSIIDSAFNGKENTPARDYSAFLEA